MKNNFIFLILIAVSTTGCAPKKATSNSNDVAGYQKQSAHPISLEKEFNSCPQIYAQSANTHFEISLLNQGIKQTNFVNLSNMLNGQRLMSRKRDIILSTQYNFSEMYSYHMWYDFIGEEWKVNRSAYAKKTLSKDQDVAICPGYSDYSKNTTESAAISANYIITKTKKELISVVPDINLEPIQIKITPLYGKKYIGKANGKKYTYTMYDTDNAFYRQKDKTIQFLPQSEEGIEANVFGGTPLWQIPMVASHEYGHHIFAQIYPQYTDYYSSMFTEYCFDNRGDSLGHLHEGDATASDSRKPQEVDNIRAINEGFADLISFYTLENNERTLKNVNCMETTRDVGSSVFADGTPKIFTEEVKNNMFSYLPNKSDQDCSTPNFQDIHITGAIFAHATDQLLNSLGASKKEKLTLLIKWLQNMNSNHDKIKAAAIDFQMRMAYSLLLKTALNYFGTSADRQTCQLANKYFPGMFMYSQYTFVEECRNLI